MAEAIEKASTLSEQYIMLGFDPKSKIAHFKNLQIPDHSSHFYMKMPEELTGINLVNSWLQKEGEDSGLIDVNIKYKLLLDALKWKNSQDSNEIDHPKVTLENANAQETYNLNRLNEQKLLKVEFHKAKIH